MPQITPNPLLQALKSLLTRDFGHANFEVNASGELVYTQTVFTERLHKGETVEVFIARLRESYGWLPGDAWDFINNGGKLDLVKITRRTE